ncbi:unnamed protein product [Calypogeia fissa]
MAKGAGSSRRKAPMGAQAEVAPPSDLPRGPDLVEAQPNVTTRATISAEWQKDKVEYAPSDRDDDLSDERKEDYEEDELSPAAQEFEISKEDDDEDVIKDDLAPVGWASRVVPSPHQHWIKHLGRLAHCCLVGRIWFKVFVTLVNNWPDLAKVGGKVSPEAGEGTKSKFVGQKRKLSEGLESSGTPR